MAYSEAARRGLRSRGITVRKTIDLLIGTLVHREPQAAATQ
jgi:hypothetical protein